MTDSKSRLLLDIDRILGYSLIELGQSQRHLARVSGKSSNTILRWSQLEFRPDANFSPEFIATVQESAGRIRRGADYRTERNMLFDRAKNQEAVGREMYVDLEKVRIRCERMYAMGIAGLWKARLNGGADIFVYRDRVKGRGDSYMGEFFMLPKETLPKCVRESPVAEKPFLSIAYLGEGHRMYFCDETGIHTPPIPFVAEVKKDVLPLFVIGPVQVYDFCRDFFRRRGYDSRKDLAAQIEQTALDEMKARYCGNISLPAYSSNHAHVPHRIESDNRVSG